MTFTLSVVPLTTPLNGITLYEKIDYDMLSALQSSNLMIPYDNWSYDNGFSHERDHLARYLTSYKKKTGLFAVEYTRGKRVIGRPHVRGSLGMWCIARKTRNTLMRHNYYDIDIKNCHPMIIYGLLQNAKYDMKKRFPYFTEYCEDRKKKIQDTIDLFKCDEKTAKNAFIRIMYNGDLDAWKNDKNNKIEEHGDPRKERFYDGFKDEVSKIIDIFIEHNRERYEKDCDTYRKEPKNKGKKNERGSFFSNVIQDYETKIISHLCSYLMSNTNITKEGDIHILIYAADGFMVLKERVDAREGGLDGFLEDMIQMAADYSGLDLEFIAKDINDPEDYHTEFKYTPPVAEPQIDVAAVKKEQKEREKEEKKAGEVKSVATYKSAFEKIKKEFEISNFKVDEISCYVQESIDEEFKRRLIPRNPAELKIAFSHLKIKYTAFEKNKMVDKVEPFIPAWLDCEEIRRYERMDCYPDVSKCPKTCFNIWNPFAMERFYNLPYKNPTTLAEEYEVKCGVETLRNHLSIMCDHNKEDLLEFEKWIAQMIQFPDTKSFMPIFQSDEGSGKGSFVQLMTKILGADKVMLTANPEEHVVGRFNNMMETTYLVFMDEISKQVTNGVIDKLKNIVTEPTIQVQHKGKGSYPMRSFHRLGGLTNVWDAGITLSKGSRRFFVVSMSDEKKGDTAYWNRFYALLENERVCLGFYDYYKNMKVDRKLPQPKTTEFAKELMTLSVDVPTLWLTDMIRDAHVNKSTHTSNNSNHYKTIDVTDANGKVSRRYVIELYGGEACKLLLEWCEANGYKKYETNAVKLGVYLSRKKFEGITKGRGLEKGNTKYYDVEKLYEELTKE
jgi:hypothetical protein